MRPGSPKRLLSSDGGNTNDRPHTISSAYEKGHQRPQLQPYTFSPPESTLTIHECEQDDETANQIASLQSNKKPPVPKRIGQLSGERPMVPSKTLAATMAAVKQQQLQQQQQQYQQKGGQGPLPSFTFNRNDMGKKISADCSADRDGGLTEPPNQCNTLNLSSELAEKYRT